MFGLQVSTPPYSPEFNGVDEPFIKTFKRDYAHMNPLHDAKTVLEMISRWFHDYNGYHPQGLKMKLPREYRRNQHK
jgi:putative transposase